MRLETTSLFYLMEDGLKVTTAWLRSAQKSPVKSIINNRIANIGCVKTKIKRLIT